MLLPLLAWVLAYVVVFTTKVGPWCGPEQHWMFFSHSNSTYPEFTELINCLLGPSCPPGHSTYWIKSNWILISSSVHVTRASQPCQSKLIDRRAKSDEAALVRIQWQRVGFAKPSPWILKLHHYLKHHHNVETRFYCPQAFLSLDFQCRDDVSELK